MENLEIIHNHKTFIIKREVIIYALYKLSGQDYSNEDDRTLKKIMKSYCLIDELVLESMMLSN